MPFPLLIPIIAGVASIVNSVIQSASANRQAKKTAQANFELSKYGYEQDKLAVTRQNQYNSPAAQMARYTEAGLNPNLIYGSGSASAGNQPSAPKFDTPRVDLRFSPFQIPEMLSQYQDYQMRQAQTDNVKAQTDNTRAETTNKLLQSNVIDLTGKHREFDLDTKSGLRPYDFMTKELATRQKGVELNKSVEQLKLLKQDQLIKMLETQAREKQLTSIDLENEKKASEILFNKYRNEWAKEGVTSADNPILRMLTRMMIQSGLSPSNFVPTFKK